jgi:hypothetical protein
VPALAQCGAILRSQNRAATCGDHLIRSRGQIGNHLRLPVAKSLFALDVEYVGNAHPGPCLDFMIGIDETALHVPRELAPHRGLAGSGHPHQKNIVPWIHQEIVAAHNKRAGSAPAP